MRAPLWIVGALAAMATLATAASAQDIRVPLDQAAAVRLPAPAVGVSIGNPSIATVSVQNNQFLFVSGRSYGTTNLVVVGQDGRIIYSGRVTVTADESNSVMLTRGTSSQRLECAPLCRPRPDIGDDDSAFERAAGQVNARSQAANRQ